MQTVNIHVEPRPSFPFKKKRKISTNLALGHIASYWQNRNLNIGVPDSQCCAHSSGSCSLSNWVFSKKWSYNARVVDPYVVTWSLKQFLLLRMTRKGEKIGLMLLLLLLYKKGKFHFSKSCFFFIFPPLNSKNSSPMHISWLGRNIKVRTP